MELLMVLGITTVLIALLMPALVKVRRQALELKCATKLRSIGQGMAMYTQQYGHYLGSALRAKTPERREREMLLKALALNVMLA